MGVAVVLLNVVLLGEPSNAGILPASFSGFGGSLSVTLQQLRFVVGWGLYAAIILVLCRLVVRNDLAAGLLAALILMIFWQFDALVARDLFTIVLVVYFGALMLFLVRFGLVAAYSFLFCNHLLDSLPLSADRLGPDVMPTFFAVGVVVAIAGYGYYSAAGGRSRFAQLAESTRRPPSES